MNIKITILSIATLFILTSCKSKKNTTKNTSATNMLFEEVVKNYHKNRFNKKTVRASIKAKYRGKSDLPKVSVSLRMKKDKIIWMSISKFISIGKLKITPKRVQFYNRLTREYFDGDFTLLSNFLGTEISFKQIQNILTGQTINDLNTKDYNIKAMEKFLSFKPKKQNSLYQLFFLLNPENFKPVKQEIQQDDKLLEIQYPIYEKINNLYFPKEILVKANDGKQLNTVSIYFKSVRFNEKLSYPFKIPEGYKEIKL